MFPVMLTVALRGGLSDSDLSAERNCLHAVEGSGYFRVPYKTVILSLSYIILTKIIFLMFEFCFYKYQCCTI